MIEPKRPMEENRYDFFSRYFIFEAEDRMGEFKDK